MSSALTFSWKAGTECCRRLFTCQYVSNSIYFSVVAYVCQWLLPRGLKKSKYNKIFDNRLDICAFFPEYYFFFCHAETLGTFWGAACCTWDFQPCDTLWCTWAQFLKFILSGRSAYSLCTRIHGEALTFTVYTRRGCAEHEQRVQYFFKGPDFLNLPCIAQMLCGCLENLGFTRLSNSVGQGLRNESRLAWFAFSLTALRISLWHA